MATATIRYIVDDVGAAIAFYCGRLGFTEVMHPAPAFAMLSRGDLRLNLSAPGVGPGGGQKMPNGSTPQPGGWNRFALEVEDLEAVAATLRGAGISFRSDLITGVGGKQLIVEDPSGNPVELFQPTREEARLRAPADRYEVRPIGHVRSTLTDPADAPNQGAQGAPDAWLDLDLAYAEGIRDIEIGSRLLVLTWLHQSRRDELSTVPGDDPTGPPRGVFSTRSPARPNPVGVHAVTVRDRAEDRLLVGPLEAVDGTPVVDIKPLLDPVEG